ncbi:hypothetical protein GMRT_11092 [Giardia muris]|uniref:Uncharacterized protein n=1 Tax=Giardia muris TaxID=5742 RepID=A0A4Z1TA53_GIAMU|nr:hypothetical protein GMRT_11092 [Giardia muris]|eukprot:TNJ30107.1 hypothetical protein GMRT_11092 [Giardia muris]
MPSRALDCRFDDPSYTICEGACRCKKCWMYPRLGCYCFNFNNHLASHREVPRVRTSMGVHTRPNVPLQRSQSQMKDRLASHDRVPNLGATPDGTLPPLSRRTCRTCEILESDEPRPCGCPRACNCNGCCEGRCPCQRPPLEERPATSPNMSIDAYERPIIMEGPVPTTCNPYRTSVERDRFYPAVRIATCHDQKSKRELARIDQEYCDIKRRQQWVQEKYEVIRELAADVPNCLVNFRQSNAPPKRLAGDTLIEDTPLILRPYIDARLSCRRE